MYTHIKTLDVSTRKYKLTNINFKFEDIDYLIQAVSERNLDKIIQALKDNIDFKTLKRKLSFCSEKLYAIYKGGMVLK